MDILNKLLEFGNEINRQDSNGDTLLHEAVLTENRELFDQLCQIPEINLDQQNQYGETALLLACQSTTTNYYTRKLLEYGANFKLTTIDGNTILHLTNDNQIINRLLELDYQLINLCNVRGESALHLACLEQHFEKIHQLLYFNADVMIRTVHNQLALEYAVINFDKLDDKSDKGVLEILLNYTFDNLDNSHDLRLFTKAMEYNSPLLSQMISRTLGLNIDKNDYLFFYNSLLCDCYQFEVFITKFHQNLIEFDLIYIGDVIQLLIRHLNDKDVDKILINSQILLDNNLIVDIINYNDDLLKQLILIFIDKQLDCVSLSKIYCFYLSYGYQITIDHLFYIYANYNYCQLFQILLFMDFNCQLNCKKLGYITPYLIINVNLTITELIRNYQLSPNEDRTFIDLLSQTALIKRNFVNYPNLNRNILGKLEKLPNVPLLIELARNQSRIFIKYRYNIDNCCQFYTILNNLPIPLRIRKILTYEIALY